MFAALKLKGEGFEPDLMVAHCGWGETLPLRSVFPKARLAVYCEFFYRPEGQDVGFDLETGQFGLDGMVGLNAKNASSLIALADCDIGVSPTPWQRSTSRANSCTRSRSRTRASTPTGSSPTRARDSRFPAAAT